MQRLGKSRPSDRRRGRRVVNRALLAKRQHPQLFNAVEQRLGTKMAIDLCSTHKDPKQIQKIMDRLEQERII